MRWPRVARIVIAVAGLGTAAAMVVYTRTRPVAGKPPVASTPADPEATLQSGRGTDITYRDNKLQYEISYATLKTYPDGRVGYEKVVVDLKNGTTLSADLVEGSGKAVSNAGPRDLVAKGHVKVTGEGNTQLQGDSMTYSDTTGIATLPGPVTFTRGRMSGTGTGGVYDRNLDTMRLLADATITMPPASNGAPAQATSGAVQTTSGALVATSRTMTFNHDTRSMLLEDQAVMTRDADRMTADRSTLFLSEDEQSFRSIELRGNARVMPIPGKASTAPDMQAQDIDLAFYASGQALERGRLMRDARMILTNAQGQRSIEGTEITFATAQDGQTLTRLESADRTVVTTPAAGTVPARTITSRKLLATGDEKGLKVASFEGGVRFVERGSGDGKTPDRTVTSETLALKLAGQIDAIDEAHFQQNVAVTDANFTGDADIGIYYASKGKFDLQPFPRSPRRLPKVVSSSLEVNAGELITVDLATRDLLARRDVSTLSKGSATAAGARADTGLFNRREPIKGYAAQFSYDAKAQSGRYQGTPARLTQGDSAVLGSELVVYQERQDLTATGDVDTTFLLASNDPRKPPVSHRVTANKLVYNDTARTATYTGTPATLKSDEGQTVGETIVLTLAAAERKLQRLQATKNVRLVMQDGRQGDGDDLVYTSADDVYVLKGIPMHLLSAKDADGSCSLTTGNFVRLNGTSGLFEFPETLNPAGTPTGKVTPPTPTAPCALPPRVTR